MRRRSLLSFVCLVVAALQVSYANVRTIPTPLPEHPGNVFLEGEEVSVLLPEGREDAWQAFDYDGKLVAEGRGQERGQLGRLPVGYYEIRRPTEEARLPISLCVLARLPSPTPKSSPIGCDVGMSWFCALPKTPALANLCTLAGLNWVRDRLDWKEMEDVPFGFLHNSRYDAAADAQSEAGLQVLQVNHNTPRWAASTDGRLPPDLRHAYQFYRQIAKRWQGKVRAFEPWNEADISFGLCTGSEIATWQKAIYLALKAGDPSLTVCLQPFATRRPVTLADFHANQAWPYFDTYNFHNYEEFDKYAAVFADHRAVSAGRPLWVTETARPVQWSGDPKLQEPDQANLRVQTERLPKTFALSLHEGAAVVFYFFLLHYVEGQIQFGLLRPDMTPRPAFVALAAVGRLLADARAAGKLQTDQQNLHVFAFYARPDSSGAERLVLVAWADNAAAVLELPQKPLAIYDLLGRAAPAEVKLKIGSAPRFIVLPAESKNTLALQPPPAAPPRLSGEPSPLVLQLLLPRKRVNLEESAYRVARGKTDRLPLFLYNFGSRDAECHLTVKGPADWNLALPKSLPVSAGGRAETDLELTTPQEANTIQTIVMEADGGAAGKALLSFRLEPEP